MSEPYTVTNWVIEVRSKLYPVWVTWAGTGDLGADADEGAAREAFRRHLKTLHNPARMQFRLVHRTAVIVDEIAIEEREDGTLDVRDRREPS